MSHVALGAVSYLNARPLVHGLDRSARFSLRFDVPSRCAELLHAGSIDVGLIPAIEYQRQPPGAHYAIVPDLAIASYGAVASVALFTTRPLDDVRSIALDTSSRTSVALVRVLCARVFHIQPEFQSRGPDLSQMLSHADAALVIGDYALLQNECDIELDGARCVNVQKLDLGSVWTSATGLPFVFAFWAGRAGCLAAEDVDALQQARDVGVVRLVEIADEYFKAAPEHKSLGARYLRDNIKYSLGSDARAGLELFYRYAAETGVVNQALGLHFF